MPGRPEGRAIDVVIDGSCPVQAYGTIDDHSIFYFRGRHERWQFIAGPKELSIKDLIKVQLKFTENAHVFVLEGDDDERLYQDYDHVGNVIQTYARQYLEWLS